MLTPFYSRGTLGSGVYCWNSDKGGIGQMSKETA